MSRKRVDVELLHAALDEARQARNLSWRGLADEVDMSASNLTRLGQGLRPDVDNFATLVQWLGLPAEVFFVGQSEAPDPHAAVAMALRSVPELGVEDVEYVQEIIRITIRWAASR